MFVQQVLPGLLPFVWETLKDTLGLKLETKQIAKNKVITDTFHDTAGISPPLQVFALGLMRYHLFLVSLTLLPSFECKC